ncbi:MAG: peroxiredoxin [Nitrososphaerales archaeon]
MDKDDPFLGASAPDFSLNDHEGRLRSLTDYSGNKLVLYFYPRDDTPGCTKEACGFRDSHDTIRKAGAEVVGVSRDGLSSHQRFRTKYSLTFPLLSDPEGEISKRYQVYKMKNLYGRKSMGIERSTFIIDEKGIIIGVFRKVRVDGHLDEILDSLK